MPRMWTTGLPELQQELQRLSNETDPRGGARETMDLATGMLHRYATGIVHVDEGRLKNSIFQDVEQRGNDLLGLVATSVEYAPIEEARGGDHAFFARTVREEGPAVNDLFRTRIFGQ